MRKHLPALLSFLLAASLTFAGTIVDQGSPGKYGPWPVTTATLGDGGVVAIPVKFFCNGTKSGITIVDGGTVANVPADGGLSGRWFIRVCVKGSNPGTPEIACTDDGQTPVAAFNGVGETIESMDCRTYYTTQTIKCVSDTALTGVTSEECN